MAPRSKFLLQQFNKHSYKIRESRKAVTVVLRHVVPRQTGTMTGGRLSNPLRGRMDTISELIEELGIPRRRQQDFRKRIEGLSEEIKAEEVINKLPSEPKRDIIPYEGIISYIKSNDGLAPWLHAGILTRPLIGKLSPKAYVSLNNWLKNPRHSLADEGLDIPDRSEVADRDVEANSKQIDKFRRLVKASDRRTAKNVSPTRG